MTSVKEEETSHKTHKKDSAKCQRVGMTFPFLVQSEYRQRNCPVKRRNGKCFFSESRLIAAGAAAICWNCQSKSIEQMLFSAAFR